MAFSDPQSITVNGNAKSLPRIGSDGSQGTKYQTADGEFTMRISHQKTKSRWRRMARVDQQVIAADPLTAENAYQTAGVYLVIDEPEFGFTDTTLDYIAAALIAWLTAPNRAKLLGGEH